MKPLGNIDVVVTACVSAMVHGAAAVVVMPVLSVIFLAYGAPLQGSTEKLMALAVLSPFVWAAVGFVLGGLMATLHNLFIGGFLAPREQTVEEPALAQAAEQSAA